MEFDHLKKGTYYVVVYNEWPEKTKFRDYTVKMYSK